MATRYADQIAVSGTPTLERTELGKRVPAVTMQNRFSVAHATYTMLGTEAAADKIRLMRGYQGMKILPHLSLVTSTGVGVTCTLDIGDTDTAGVGALADPDRYADGLNVAAAGEDLFSANACAALRTPYVLGADAWIEATFATLSTPTEDGVLQFLIAYFGA